MISRLADWQGLAHWKRLEEWQRRTLVYVTLFALCYGLLSLTPAPDYASALAGTEPSLFGSFVGIAFVMTRLLTIVFAPVGLLAVLLGSVGTWLVRRFAPSPPDVG